MYDVEKFSREIVLDRFASVCDDLQSVYDSLPRTVGCMDSIKKKEDSCGAWCCEEQSPSVWFVELLNAFEKFVFKMDIECFTKLIELCLKKYLLVDKGGGCVFWDRDTKMCLHHESRPVNCYFYGVTPQEEFKPRYERLKVLNNSIRPQCGLIKLEDGSSFMSRKAIDDSFNKIKQLEEKIGVPKDMLSDSLGGSYRTYPEHILLWMLGEDQMCDLSIMRSSKSVLDKKKFIAAICGNLTTSLSNA
tara:strand:- start:2023 stop:2760 length:738 start_codon:yes stop_codon:yes gene_type:complete